MHARERSVQEPYSTEQRGADRGNRGYEYEDESNENQENELKYRVEKEGERKEMDS